MYQLVPLGAGHDGPLVSMAALIAVKAGQRPRLIFRVHLNTHVSEAMRELVAAPDWLTVYQLPPYASELNPVESALAVLKRSLANLAKRDIAQLTALARTRLRRMQYRPGLLTGVLAGTRLDLTPLCDLRN